MKKELENKIFERFPTLFPNGRNVDTKKSLMSFGIEVGEGWYDLIYELCEKIERILNQKGNGKLKENFIVVQIKEKFGMLRYYCNGGNKLIWDTISIFEKESSIICEYCGKPGKLSNNQGWFLTLCRDCKNKKQKQYEEKIKNRGIK